MRVLFVAFAYIQSALVYFAEPHLTLPNFFVKSGSNSVEVKQYDFIAVEQQTLNGVQGALFDPIFLEPNADHVSLQFRLQFSVFPSLQRTVECRVAAMHV